MLALNPSFHLILPSTDIVDYVVNGKELSKLANDSLGGH